jgi:hypothetical protein
MGLNLTALSPTGLDKSLVNVAPTPFLTWLKGLNNRMTSCMEVLSRMFILRGVTAADVTTN